MGTAVAQEMNWQLKIINKGTNKTSNQGPTKFTFLK